MPRIPSSAVVAIIMSTVIGTVASAQETPLPANWRRMTTDEMFKQRPMWQPDGTTLVFARHTEESIFVYRCDADGANDSRLFEGTTFNFNAAFSPDGKRVAYEHDKLSPGQGDMEIYLADADGQNPQPLFVTEGRLSHEEWPSWSPDGKWIVCSSTRDANPELYLLSVPSESTATPAVEPKRLTSDPAIDNHPCFSPDGKQVAFATNRWGDLEIAIFDLETSSVTRLTASPGLDDYPAWSPDGKQIAFTSLSDGDLDIFVMNADGSDVRNATRHVGFDHFPSWSPDGALTFVSFFEGGWDVFVIADED